MLLRSLYRPEPVTGCGAGMAVMLKDWMVVVMGGVLKLIFNHP
jgi:hypothetical protein